jgi:hypothetical protein
MKVRIQTDGTLNGSTVCLSTGEVLPHVTSAMVTVDWNAGAIPRAVLELLLTEVDLIAEADCFVTVMPDGTRYRLVEVNDAD